MAGSNNGSHIWRCTIPLAPCSMKNSRRLVFTGHTPRLIKSEAAQQFERDAGRFFRAMRPNLPFRPTDKLALTCIVRYADYRRDLDIELVKDVLQAAGVIPNDKQIRRVSAEAMDSVGEPQTIIELERIGQLPWKPKTKEAR